MRCPFSDAGVASSEPAGTVPRGLFWQRHAAASRPMASGHQELSLPPRRSEQLRSFLQINPGRLREYRV